MSGDIYIYWHGLTYYNKDVIVIMMPLNFILIIMKALINKKMHLKALIKN